MKTAYFFITAFVLTPFYAITQKHDNIWMHIAPQEDTIGAPIDPPYPAAIQRFNTSPPEIIYYQAPYTEAVTNITMCDEEGAPLFYTNGYDIYHFSGKLIENGDSLAPKAFQKAYLFGYAAEMPMMCIPRPGRRGDYYLLLLYKEPNWTYTPLIMLSLITGATEPDSGRVEFKNKIIFAGHNRIDFFNMTKHANGRDWWVVFSDFDTDNRIRTFHSIYLGSDTAYVANSQVINGYEPAPEHPWQIYTAQRVFSPKSMSGNF